MDYCYPKVRSGELGSLCVLGIISVQQAPCQISTPHLGLALVLPPFLHTTQLCKSVCTAVQPEEKERSVKKNYLLMLWQRSM